VWKTKRKPNEFEIRIIKTLEEGNQPKPDLLFYKAIKTSLQNFNEEETLKFQMAVLQLLALIKHRKPSNFSSQPLPMYNQPFHTSSHVGRNNPLIVYASATNPHHSNITAVQLLAVDTVMMPRTVRQEPATRNPPLSPPIPNQYGQYFPPRTVLLQYTLRLLQPP